MSVTHVIGARAVAGQNGLLELKQAVYFDAGMAVAVELLEGYLSRVLAFLFGLLLGAGLNMT